MPKRHATLPRAQLSWRTAATLATRELRSGLGRFAFVVVAVALGVGALAGVRSFSQSFRTMLLTQARGLIAGDIALRAPAETSPAQAALLASLAREGVRSTRITESVSMAQAETPVGGSTVVQPPILVTLKAVDPARYPFSGTVSTTPPGALARLDDQSVLVSPDLLLRTGLAPGAVLSVGGQPFRILGVDEAEPDRLEGGLGIGPRLLMTNAGLANTGIIQFGSQVSSRILFQLGAGSPSLGSVEAQLRRVFPRSRVDDFRHANPTVERALDHSTTFLSLISLMALVIGAVGVASAMHAHLQLRLDSIATMKVLGARNSQIMRIYGLQTLLLGLAGGALGIVLSAVVARIFPLLLRSTFPNLPRLGWSWGPALAALAAGILVTLLFTLPTLLGVRQIRPAQILRRHMVAAGGVDGATGKWGRVRRSLLSLGTTALLLAAVAGLAIALTDEPWRSALKIGGIFALALAVAMAALAGLSWMLLRLLRGLVKRWPRAPIPLRHGLANLYRPGSLAQPVLIALGVGVMFTLTVFLLQRALLQDLRRGTPTGVANVFLIDIPPQRAAALLQMLRRQAGIEGAPEIISSVSVRLDASRRPTTAAEFAAPPSGVRLVEGTWEPGSGRDRVALSAELASRLHLHLGDAVRWNLASDGPGAVPHTARLAATFEAEPHRMIARVAVIFTPGTLPATAARQINGGVRVAPTEIPLLESTLYAAYPTVTVVNLADVIERVQQVVDQIAVVVHFIAFFAVLAGAIILGSSVAGTRFRRMREIAILKTYGGTRARVAQIFSTEFLLLGLVAGGAGSLLAIAFTNVITHRLLQVPFRPDLPPNLIAIGATALIAVAAGWLASARILGQKPLAVLRAE